MISMTDIAAIVMIVDITIFYHKGIIVIAIIDSISYFVLVIITFIISILFSASFIIHHGSHTHASGGEY